MFETPLHNDLELVSICRLKGSHTWLPDAYVELGLGLGLGLGDHVVRGGGVKV